MKAKQRYNSCVRFLKNYVSTAGFSDVVVGLSGGIDSALVAVMCVDAFGADHVHGVLLPGPYSSDHSIDDAQALAANLAISAQIISITEPYEAFDRVLRQSQEAEGNNALEGLAAQNVQARCRMVCLMALSNLHGWMMINTGNKSEALMGYSTLYGDMAGAVAPLGGLYKTDVYELARWRNEQDAQVGRAPSIPQNTIDKAPSAELAPDQLDEKAMGIGYEQLDRILTSLVEEGRAPQEVALQGFDLEEVRRIDASAKAAAFKRQYEPPYPDEGLYL